MSIIFFGYIAIGPVEKKQVHINYYPNLMCAHRFTIQTG